MTSRISPQGNPSTAQPLNSVSEETDFLSTLPLESQADIQLDPDSVIKTSSLDELFVYFPSRLQLCKLDINYTLQVLKTDLILTHFLVIENTFPVHKAVVDPLNYRFRTEQGALRTLIIGANSTQFFLFEDSKTAIFTHDLGPISSIVGSLINDKVQIMVEASRRIHEFYIGLELVKSGELDLPENCLLGYTDSQYYWVENRKFVYLFEGLTTATRELSIRDDLPYKVAISSFPEPRIYVFDVGTLEVFAGDSGDYDREFQDVERFFVGGVEGVLAMELRGGKVRVEAHYGVGEFTPPAGLELVGVSTKKIFFASSDCIRVLELDSGNFARGGQGEREYPRTGLDNNQCRDRLIAGTLTAETKEIIGKLQLKEGEVEEVCVIQDALVTIGKDCSIKVWDKEYGKLILDIGRKIFVGLQRELRKKGMVGGGVEGSRGKGVMAEGKPLFLVVDGLMRDRRFVILFEEFVVAVDLESDPTATTADNICSCGYREQREDTGINGCLGSTPQPPNPSSCTCNRLFGYSFDIVQQLPSKDPTILIAVSFDFRGLLITNTAYKRGVEGFEEVNMAKGPMFPSAERRMLVKTDGGRGVFEFRDFSFPERIIERLMIPSSGAYSFDSVTCLVFREEGEFLYFWNCGQQFQVDMRRRLTALDGGVAEEMSHVGTSQPSLELVFRQRKGLFNYSRTLDTFVVPRYFFYSTPRPMRLEAAAKVLGSRARRKGIESPLALAIRGREPRAFEMLRRLLALEEEPYVFSSEEFVLLLEGDTAAGRELLAEAMIEVQSFDSAEGLLDRNVEVPGGVRMKVFVSPEFEQRTLRRLLGPKAARTQPVVDAGPQGPKPFQSGKITPFKEKRDTGVEGSQNQKLPSINEAWGSPSPLIPTESPSLRSSGNTSTRVSPFSLRNENNNIRLSRISQMISTAHVISNPSTTFPLTRLPLSLSLINRKILPSKVFKLSGDIDLSPLTHPYMTLFRVYKNCEEEIFVLSPFRHIVDARWSTLFYHFVLYSCLQITLFVLYYILVYFPQDTAIFIIFIFLLSLHSLWEIIGLLMDFSDYVSSVINVIDFLVSVMGYSSSIWGYIAEPSAPLLYFQVLGMIFFFFRMLVNLKLIPSMTNIMTSLLNIAWLVKDLLLVFVIFIFVWSSIYVKAVEGETFGVGIYLVFFSIFGGVDSFEREDTLQWIVVVCIGFIITLLLVNFLIARMGALYGEFEQKQKVLECAYRGEICYDFDLRLLFWFSLVKNPNFEGVGWRKYRKQRRDSYTFVISNDVRDLTSHLKTDELKINDVLENQLKIDKAVYRVLKLTEKNSIFKVLEEVQVLKAHVEGLKKIIEDIKTKND